MSFNFSYNLCVKQFIRRQRYYIFLKKTNIFLSCYAGVSFFLTPTLLIDCKTDVSTILYRFIKNYQF
jgi:hypothetical protein